MGAPHWAPFILFGLNQHLRSRHAFMFLCTPTILCSMVLGQSAGKIGTHLAYQTLLQQNPVQFVLREKSRSVRLKKPLCLSCEPKKLNPNLFTTDICSRSFIVGESAGEIGIGSVCKKHFTAAKNQGSRWAPFMFPSFWAPGSDGCAALGSLHPVRAQSTPALPSCLHVPLYTDNPVLQYAPRQICGKNRYTLGIPNSFAAKPCAVCFAGKIEISPVEETIMFVL